MRTKEYKKIVEKNGYRYYETNYSIIARKYLDEYYDIEIKVGKLRPGRLEVNIKGFCGDESDIILEAMELAETPLDDREEKIKKYFYKHNSMKTKGGNPTYLAIRQRPSISYPVLQGSSEDIFEYKVEFTDEEIKKAQMEHGIFLDDFEKNEVEGD